MRPFSHTSIVVKYDMYMYINIDSSAGKTDPTAKKKKQYSIHYSSKIFIDARNRLDALYVHDEYCITQNLTWFHDYHGSVSGFDHFGIFLQHFSASAVDFLLYFCELAGDVCGVAVEHWLVAGVDLARVPQDDHLPPQTSVYI